MPISPMMQQQQEGMAQGPDQEDALFSQGFSDMAYSLLSTKMPDILNDVVTFKVIDTDIEKGYGIGAFVILKNNQPIYIPTVMADNAIKPLEIFYHKTNNVFLPLTQGWLDEVEKKSLSSLGGGVKTPETLYTDVDIRNIMVPPITGRFSYAEERQNIDAIFLKENLEKTAEAPGLMLPRLLAQAPNSLKTAYTKLLSKNPRLMKQAAEVYGVSALAEALQHRVEKVAAKQNFGGALWIADKDNTPADFRRIFGDKAGEAYAGVRKKGFAAKDERLNRNMVVKEQPYERWIEPNQPGIYCLYGSSGEEDYAFVMPNPIDIFDKGTRYGRRPAIPGHNPLIDNSYYDPEMHGSSNKVYPQGRPDEGSFAIRREYSAKPYLAVFGDGKYIETMKLVGRDSVADDVAGDIGKRLFKDVSGDPKTGKGFFVRQKGSSFQATVPLEIKSITTGEDGIRRLKVTRPGSFMGEEKVVATDPSHPYGTIWMPRGADVVYLPPDFIWVPLKEKLNENSWFGSAMDLQACVSSMLSSVGAKKVAIKDAGANQYSIAGSLGLERVAALKKLAFEYRISVDDADAVLTKVADEYSTSVWVVSGEQLARAQMSSQKLAAPENGAAKKPAKAAPEEEAPPQDSMPPDDGSGMGQDAAMAAMGQPPAPQQPAPLDMAAAEMDQHIQQEMQKLVERQQTIQMLMQRSQEIAGGAPPDPTVQTQMMGAPPSSMNMATGMPAQGAQPGMQQGMQGGMPQGMGQMGGMQGGMPGMDPSMMGGMSQGMDPSMMGQQGMQPGMDPSMMGGMQGMDPSMMGQGQAPMQATMPPNGPNAMTLPQEVNPAFLNQAAQLHAADMFDAAAVAMLARSPALQNVVEQYVPNLEKSVDNLARVMLTLWMSEADLKPQVGEVTFNSLEDNIKATLKGLGDLVLQLSRGIQAVKQPDQYEM